MPYMRMIGTMLWMLVADTYPDYDGYSIYTSKGAAAKPQPAWPDQDSNLMADVRCHLGPSTSERLSVFTCAREDVGRAGCGQ